MFEPNRLAAGLLFLIACGGKSAGKIADDHRAKAEPIIAQLKALAPIAKAAPTLTATAWQLPPGVAVDFDMTMPNEANANAGAVSLGTLADPCNGDLTIKWNDGKELAFPLDKTDVWLRDPACLLATGKGKFGNEDLDKDQVERKFKLLESVKYVLVVRPTSLVRPVIQDKDQFTMGTIAGDVHLYELATQKDLGGFAFSVASADTIKVVGPSQSDQVAEDLTKDTRFELSKQLFATKQIKGWP
jgi:hypothetical protein